MGLYQIVKYGLEAQRLNPQLVATYRHQMEVALSSTAFGLDQNALGFLRSIDRARLPIGFLGYTGVKILHMYGNGNVLPREIQLVVGNKSIQTLGLVGIVDDVIDRKEVPYEQKKEFLDSVKSVLFTGNAPEEEIIGKRVSYLIAKMLHHEVIKREPRFVQLYERMRDCVLNQFSATDPLEAHALAKEIGASTAEQTALLSELAIGHEDENVRTAVKLFGSFGQILDDLHDIDQDIRDGINTFPTLILASKGDTKALRREVTKFMLDDANSTLEQGLVLLRTNEQREIFDILSQLYKIRYRFFYI